MRRGNDEKNFVVPSMLGASSAMTSEYFVDVGAGICAATTQNSNIIIKRQ